MNDESVALALRIEASAAAVAPIDEGVWHLLESRRLLRLKQQR